MQGVATRLGLFCLQQHTRPAARSEGSQNKVGIMSVEERTIELNLPKRWDHALSKWWDRAFSKRWDRALSKLWEWPLQRVI